MQKIFLTLLLSCWFISSRVFSQCSICAKTTAQMGEGPAKGMNSGIIYLMLAPLLIAIIGGLRWWRAEKKVRV